MPRVLQNLAVVYAALGTALVGLGFLHLSVITTDFGIGVAVAAGVLSIAAQVFERRRPW